MIWALLVFVGVPAWLCAAGILALVYRNRALRHRYGDIPVRVLRAGKTRWTRGHAVWVSDVFAWRGSPAAWNEDLELIVSVDLRDTTLDGQKGAHGMGADAVGVSLTTEDGTVLQVATAAEHRAALIGPFAPSTEPA